MVFTNYLPALPVLISSLSLAGSPAKQLNSRGSEREKTDGSFKRHTDGADRLLPAQFDCNYFLF